MEFAVTRRRNYRAQCRLATLLTVHRDSGFSFGVPVTYGLSTGPVLFGQ
jgi:hypothetical protein